MFYFFNRDWEKEVRSSQVYRGVLKAQEYLKKNLRNPPPAGPAGPGGYPQNCREQNPAPPPGRPTAGYRPPQGYYGRTVNQSPQNPQYGGPYSRPPVYQRPKPSVSPQRSPKHKTNSPKEVPPGMRAQQVKSPVPFYLVGVCWFMCALIFPMYRWFDFVLIAAASAAVFLLARKIFPGTTILLPNPEKPAETGVKEVDKLIAEGREYLVKMRNARAAIDNEEISNQIVQLAQLTQKIFAYIAEHPQKTSQIRKFMNYYLPTTMKLLESYDRLEEQGIQGENISSTMHSIEGMMHTIVLAFEKQLDYLFQDEAMDISTDITVMEGMLEQEGLTNHFQKSNSKQDKPNGRNES